MNETNINTELLAESRGRKHIPLAVFAVIVIHVALFLVLLIAAGCRAKAKAKLSPEGAAVAEAATPAVHPELMPAGVETAASVEGQAAGAAANLVSQAEEPAIASEPEEERERASAPGPRRAPQRALASRPRAVSAEATPAARKGSGGTEAAGAERVYVVQPGDTVGKIAKEHGVSIQSIRTQNKLKKDMIYPGQKLRLSPKQTSRQMAAL